MCLSLTIVGCVNEIPWKTAPTPEPGGTVQGTLHAWVDGAPIKDRHIVLCRSQGDPREGNCDLMNRAVDTDFFGRFEIADVPQGTYFVLYDSGLSDFNEALDRWGGETLHFGSLAWLSDFLGVDLENEEPTFRIPQGIEISPHDDWLRPYCVVTLLVGNSPFIIAHDLELVKTEEVVSCELLTVEVDTTVQVDLQVIQFERS